MKNRLILASIFIIVFGSLVFGQSIILTPSSPKVSDSERQSELASRREKVSEKIGKNSMMILLSAESKIYTNDVDFHYRQENNLYYLTNLKQQNATLVILNDGVKTQEVLFLPKRNPQFETWNGKMYSNEDATRISGISTIIDSAEFPKFVEALKEKKVFTSKNESVINTLAEKLYLNLPQSEFDSDGKREFRKEAEFIKTITNFKIENAQNIFAPLRLIKSPLEIKLLQHAIDITTESQMRAMATIGHLSHEYEVQAEVEYVFRRRNADFWGYPSIVGCGPNATTLHYVESQSAVTKGDLMLLDVGAEYDHYTADVTRTFPVNGKFTKEQREIYQIVFDAQEAVAREIKPGATMAAVESASYTALEAGLVKLGLVEKIGAIIPGTEEVKRGRRGGGVSEGVPQVSLWALHGNSHWLGMNVHDVGSYGSKFSAGMVFTNEPGIYLREDALDYLPKKPETQEFIAKMKPLFEKYKNIGVRIEDDMLVTENGVEWMTKALPRTIDAIEKFMAKATNEKLHSVSDKDFTNLPLSFLYDSSVEAIVTSVDRGKTNRKSWIHNH
jgi:Xaa-Pro aminopeptidase